MGFTEEEARAIIGHYNGILWNAAQQPDSYRDELLMAVRDLHLDGLNAVEAANDAGQIAGDIDKNREEIGELRQVERGMLDKITALTEDQARQIHEYAIGFWDGVASR
jgi:hypothetical protein